MQLLSWGKYKISIFTPTHYPVAHFRRDPVFFLSCDQSGLHTCNYCCDVFGWFWRQWGQSDWRRRGVSTACHCREREHKTRETPARGWQGWGVGGYRWKLSKQGWERERAKGSARGNSTAGIPVGYGTHTHTVSATILPSLSLAAGPDLPLWPGWWQRMWHWPLSWALLPQRKARALQCARACWSGRGESEPVNMTGVPSLKHWLVWHAHVHINVIQTCVCVHSPLTLTLSLPNPASTPFPLIQIKSFQTQISIIHLIQIMPCDKNYPYCNNPLNWERAAHQKEKGEKGLEVRVVGVTCQPVSNQDPHNKNFFPFLRRQTWSALGWWNWSKLKESLGECSHNQ